MNPSATGWIEKFLTDHHKHTTAGSLPTLDMAYPSLRQAGFIYGTSIQTFINTSSKIVYSEEEKTKINLLGALIISYYDTIEDGTDHDCIDALIQFYEYMDTKKSYFSFLQSISSKNTDRLERILHTRIQTNESIFKKNFSHLLTNALLFIDVLAFEYFLIHNKNPFDYASKLEETITQIVFLSLHSKPKKDSYDELVLKLFASSVRYNKIHDTEYITLKDINVAMYADSLEKKYILDLTSLANWNENQASQHSFILSLGNQLNVSDLEINNSLSTVQSFINAHKEDISFFNYSNPAHHFYKQTSRTVSIAILRNKKRLINEITQSKELMILLGQSTTRELSSSEKQKVKRQLLDICKTIPSLAIFILPGGSLLLPLLIKFIPQLLPSAFNENKQ